MTAISADSAVSRFAYFNKGSDNVFTNMRLLGRAALAACVLAGCSGILDGRRAIGVRRPRRNRRP